MPGETKNKPGSCKAQKTSSNFFIPTAQIFIKLNGQGTGPGRCYQACKLDWFDANYDHVSFVSRPGRGTVPSSAVGLRRTSSIADTSRSKSSRPASVISLVRRQRMRFVIPPSRISGVWMAERAVGLTDYLGPVPSTANSPTATSSIWGPLNCHICIASKVWNARDFHAGNIIPEEIGPLSRVFKYLNWAALPSSPRQGYLKRIFELQLSHALSPTRCHWNEIGTQNSTSNMSNG
ncbi:hypothetical protein SODALDRAFT_359256 [Sodiomyces alkalinus F11]|uniref:Uncharacterized protein n=1 Tax=Sodiomyces alkalinus (strain CBS 110278 / VKM F-3762 / F11) TaxID=1314773 RepID=A0A3N2PY17_SODAK|nr:hypothetical protein SODALDRAFT_359256 [Sodiomyces alkalinus F11]ROT39364.1 hypothetical protein SODALDRAFT_359256 [Sodiomyces alkalinus F11]